MKYQSKQPYTMAIKKVYYTQEGLEKIKHECRELEEKEMMRIAKQIGEAIAKGDLSENAEYHAAKDKQRITSMRIQELKNAMAHAVVLDPKKVDTNQVSILTTAEIEDQSTKEKFTYTLVSEGEADMKAHKLSITSPLGRGLLGKKVNEVFSIGMPAPRYGSVVKQSRKFKILSISVS